MKIPTMLRWGIVAAASAFLLDGCATAPNLSAVTSTTTHEESVAMSSPPPAKRHHHYNAARSPASELPPIAAMSEATPPPEDGLGPAIMTGSASPESTTAPTAPNAEARMKATGIVKLYYATDRTWTGSATQPKWFGSKWNTEGGHLTYGTCNVSIPLAVHATGEVEKPSIFKLELTEDPAKHVVVYKPEQLAQTAFFQALGKEVRERQQKEVVIFIHGFNNTFDEAASRLGVLAYDMDFAGVPVLYSWPAVGGGFWGTRDYPHDAEVIERTKRPLTDFLAMVAQTGRDAGAQRVNIIAHSMGNRALVAAMQNLAERSGGRMLFDEVVMAAPDVPAEGFASDEWPRMRKGASPAGRVTLYASSDDRALKASQGLNRFRRIGEAGDGLLVLPGLDTIDATGCDFSRFGLNHSYFGGPRVMGDLRVLLHRGLGPAARKLRAVKRGQLPYWQLSGLAGG